MSEYGGADGRNIRITFIRRRKTQMILQITGLVKTYETGETALNGVDLDIPEGQVVALIGASGAGKSTLIRCVNRLIEPTSGEIYLQGTNVLKARGEVLRRIRRRIGMIFQEYALVDRLTVMENVLSGQLGYVGFWRSALRRFPSETVKRAFEMLDSTGLSDHADKRADELSGGQRQRVGTARALLQQPDLLLVDEPTASLDPKTARQIMRLIVQLANERNLPAIINIHDVPLAQQFVNRIIGLRKGTIIFDGAPDDLDADVLTEIYGEEDWSVTDTGGNDQESEREIELSGTES